MQSVFEALAHPVRREILKLLRKRAMSAGELASAFPVSKATLSGHFNVLKNANLVTTERKGTTIIYRLNESVLEQIIAAMMDLGGVGKRGSDGDQDE
ncbi:MAG TPA: ArsR family transcriptional regulator [Alphaproteobacteria bacterium]|nr:ArsR family transcriptional regulator [Alphaproteobacteria bacterium]HAJ46084.1 ArsR family transcriptional regulator [Alphaproteobacteria bacterium]